MFQNVQRRLVFLYVLTSGIILTLALGITAFLYSQTVIRQQEAVFQANIAHIMSRIQSSNNIPDSWLRELEMQEKLVIRIEENNIPLLYQGAYETPTQREDLFLTVSEKVDSIYRQEALASPSPYQSGIFHTEGLQGDRYLGAYIVLEPYGSYISILVLNDITGVRSQLRLRLCYFLILEFLCLGALFLIGRTFIRHVMYPVRENERMQNEFVAAASHELRTPIMLIQGAADSMDVFPEKADYFGKIIRKECSRMRELVKDLLILTSSLEAPIGSFQLFDPVTLLMELYESYLPLCHTKGLILNIELPQEYTADLKSNPSYISQILRIFLDNAIAFSPPGRDILLKEQINKNSVYFQVIDHGPGILAEDKQQIFQKFYRGDKSRTDKEHFGLGLSIAKKYTLLLGGQILLRDTEGGGCTFTLKLPLHRRGGD
ncbi:MAG: HAMP domain-containing sensor histidine kinase [Lachnospiraceae bacterium]|jgi:OmpR-family two-component system manganese-sensing sensor histidine kinase|nr:HAMP domain-containing sensor histidine kinase [Lachnospiraceae bacterium]